VGTKNGAHSSPDACGEEEVVMVKDRFNNFLLQFDRWAANKRIYLILFGLALATRLVGVFLGGDRGDDEGPYLAMAQGLLAGEGLRMDMSDLGIYSSWLPPGMAVLRAFFLVIFEQDFIPLRIFFLLTSCLTILLFFPLCKRFFTPRYALLATLFWILYPPLFLRRVPDSL